MSVADMVYYTGEAQPPPTGEAPPPPTVHTETATPTDAQPPPPAAVPGAAATAEDNTSGTEKINNKKTFVRQPVELKFVNCGSKANPSGAGEKLKKKSGVPTRSRSSRAEP